MVIPIFFSNNVDDEDEKYDYKDNIFRFIDYFLRDFLENEREE